MRWSTTQTIVGFVLLVSGLGEQLARYLADFNRPRYEWWDGETPGPWSTLMVVVAVLAVVVFLVGR